jgi:Outer membrane protein beta-barrel domain
MKKTILLVFVLIFMNQALFSQSNVSIGIIGGPTAAYFTKGYSSVPKKWIPSASLGAAIRVQLKKPFFFQTDISYERKGFSYGEIEITDFNANPIGTKKLDELFDYALITTTIGFKTSGKVHFEGSLGVFGGYLTNLKSQTRAFLPTGSGLFFRPFRVDDFNRFDFGVASRLGVGFDLAKKLSVTVNAVGNFGFAEPYKPLLGAARGFGTDRTLSLGLQFGVFYKI